MTDAQINDTVGKLRIAFGVETTDDLVDKMVDRFLCWKLPGDFEPDAGIVFRPVFEYDRDDYRWPIGTNLLNAGQAKEMVRHILGVPNNQGEPGATKDD